MSRDISLPARFYRTFPIDNPLGHTIEQLALRVERTALLLIDVYGLGYDEGKETSAHHNSNELPFYLQQVGANRRIVVDHIVPTKSAAQAAGVPVIYLANRLSPSLTENSVWRNLSLRVHNVDVLEAWRGPDGGDGKSGISASSIGFSSTLEYSEIIRPGCGDYHIVKQMYSGFFETTLESLLTGLGVTNLIMVGFDSNICLAMTAVEAMYRDYRVIALRDAIGTSPHANGYVPSSPEADWLAERAIRFIETNVGYTAASNDWILGCNALAGSQGE
jgi:nicotinamidase-related amidase